MLSREDRILSELIVSRGLAEPTVVERRARELEDSDERGLLEALVSNGELDPETGKRVRDEAREIDGLLQADLPDGQTLGDFRLLREIGRGGMGIVYEAEQITLGRRVALKVLPAGAALDERLAIRFLREARTAARLRHPGIVPVFGTGHEQGVLFFAMELVDGESLADRIDRGPVPPAAAARIAAEVAHALQHAHEAGLIHRDVKPDNVILGADGRARLADFGLVHDLQGARLTRSHYVLGTPAYSAPEQARGEPVDPRSDIYGVGAVLYAMLTGKPPFEGEVPAAVLGRLVSERPPSLARAAPRAPRALVAICERAMAREPERRYPHAGELAAELDGFGEAGAQEHPSTGRSGLAGWLVAGAVTVLAAALVAGLLLTPREEPAGPEATATGNAPELHTGFRLPDPLDLRKRDAVLSPDGESVLFQVLSGSERLTYRQGIDGSLPAPLTTLTGEVSLPAWSPDGARLAFCSPMGLEVLELETGVARHIARPCGRTSWAPDGRTLVHSERTAPIARLRVVDTATGDSRVITGTGSTEPNWSNGGTRIAYVALQDGQYDIWTVPAAGGEPTQVTRDAAWDWHPVWSPDDERLYYGSDRGGRADLWTVQIDRRSGAAVGAPVQVTRGWAGARFRLSAAREQERLALLAVSRLYQVWSMRLDERADPLEPPQPSPSTSPTTGWTRNVRPTERSGSSRRRRGRRCTCNAWGPTPAPWSVLPAVPTATGRLGGLPTESGSRSTRTGPAEARSGSCRPKEGSRNR